MCDFLWGLPAVGDQMGHKPQQTDPFMLQLGVVLLLCLFSRIIAADFLKPMTHLAVGSWPHWQFKVLVLSLGEGLKSNQNVVGYFYNILPLLLQRAYLARKIFVVTQRIHSWMSLMIIFLLWWYA